VPEKMVATGIAVVSGGVAATFQGEVKKENREGKILIKP